MNDMERLDAAQTTPSSQFTAKTAARVGIVEKIRSELNIEKWPAIWQPAKSKNKPALRSMEREVTAEDGSRMVSRVEVGYTQLGTLSTEEQKLLYVLIKLWEDADKPDVQVFFSTRALARMLKKNGWGTNVIQSITKSLRKLRTIPIEWVNSYFDRTETGAVIVDRRPFSILGDLRIVERRQDGAVNTSLGYFKFDDHILSNLKRNYTKPVCIEEFFKLKSEIAQLVYSHIDLMLFDKTKYERKSKELFDDLGLKNPEYGHMYERKRALEKAVRELQGLPISSGVIRYAAVEKTKDGKDYKISFQKAARAETTVEVLAVKVSAPVVINDYSKQPDPLTMEAERVVRYFHKIFHGLETHSTKETSQALSLISQHGTEACLRIIDFTRTEAEKTNYQIQHFGAVLSYASRALAERNQKRQNSAPPTRPFSPVGQPDETQIQGRGELRLAFLTKEQSHARFEKAKSELQAQNPFLSRHWKDGSEIYEKMIRARVIRALTTECMDLLPVDPTFHTKYPWYGKSATQDLPR